MFQSKDFTDSSRLPLTPAAYRHIERELERLLAEKEEHVDRLRAAREYGDPQSNDEHLAIREDEAIVEARIKRLEDIIARADIVDAAADGETIAIGSEVTIRDRQSGRTSYYLVDGVYGQVRANVVSALSPVGSALIGRRRGALVQIELPRGGRKELEVVEVRGGALA